ncbi:MAG: GuaB3 family IMP dehydrogenase-related protein [Elusimicrobiota bacterium]
MTFFIGYNREARRAYGFDEVAIVPNNLTINPSEINITTGLGTFGVKIPFISSAMDGVVSPEFALKFATLGGIAVLNMDGIYTRYVDYQTVLNEIISAPQSKSTQVIQKIYKEPVKEKLISERVEYIKRGVNGSCLCAVSTIPQNAPEFSRIAQEAGADILFVQATILTVRHISSQYKSVDLKKLCSELKIPVVLGNCVSYDSALELMDTGCVGILVGVGPGSACTTRGVLGIGVPQVTATIDCAAARDYHLRKTGRYVSIITDGGMNTGGDICKAFVSGADAVMLGSAFARAVESPGKGYHWGMAMPHHFLPRGTKIFVGTTGTLEEILFGPARVDDGTQNLVGALRTSMGCAGCGTIKEFQLAKLIIAPDIKSEGKLLQKAQKVGMGK